MDGYYERLIGTPNRQYHDGWTIEQALFAGPGLSEHVTKLPARS